MDDVQARPLDVAAEVERRGAEGREQRGDAAADVAEGDGGGLVEDQACRAPADGPSSVSSLAVAVVVEPRGGGVLAVVVLDQKDDAFGEVRLRRGEEQRVRDEDAAALGPAERVGPEL